MKTMFWNDSLAMGQNPFLRIENMCNRASVCTVAYILHFILISFVIQNIKNRCIII